MNAGTNPRRNYVGFRVPREFPEHPSGVPQCLVTCLALFLSSNHFSITLFDINLFSYTFTLFNLC